MLRQYPDNQAEMGNNAFIKPEHMHTDACTQAHMQTHLKTDEQKESAQAHGKLSAVNVVHYDSAAPL